MFLTAVPNKYKAVRVGEIVEDMCYDDSDDVYYCRTYYNAVRVGE